MGRGHLYPVFAQLNVRKEDTPQMDLNLNPHEQRLVNRAREFTREMVAPNAAEWEGTRKVPVDTIITAASEGLLGLLVLEEHGGQGVSYTAMARIMEEIASGCMFFAFSLVVHNNLANAISRNGTRKQIKQFIPGLIEGKRIGAFCLTEPEAGSDAAAITTEAKATDEGWVLNGHKAWITNGTVANIFNMYAQTDPALGWRGIVSILVEDCAPGLQRGEMYRVLCGHAMGTAELKLENCRVPRENLLIGPGDAFRAAMLGINIARAFVGAMCCGMVKASLDCAVDYASERKVFGRSVSSFQGIRWQLADVATNLEASRLLTYRTTLAVDRGVDATVEAAHAKKFATRVALTDISNCMQAMGAEGFRADHPLGRHLAGAKMAQYLDGTTEIQNIVISRAMFKSSGG
jgi:alkylation response protein AidB-like acyl-CoA dehydrogenase